MKTLEQVNSGWRRRIREEQRFLRVLLFSAWTYLFLGGAVLVLLVGFVLRPAPVIQVGQPGTAALLQGFFAPEQLGNRSFRWSQGQSTILFPAAGLSSRLTLLLRAAGDPRMAKPLTIRVGDVPVAEISIRPEPATYAVALDLPAGTGARTIPIVLSCPTFRPADDPRDLGIQLERVALLPWGQNLAVLPWGYFLLLLALVVALYVVALRLTLRPWAAALLAAPALALAGVAVQRAWLTLPLYLPCGAGEIGVVALFLFCFAPEVQRDGLRVLRSLVRGRPQALVSRTVRVTRPWALFWVVQALALVVLALHLLAPYLPMEGHRFDSYAWGVRFFSRLPLVWQVAAAALVVAAGLASPWLARRWTWLARRWPRFRHLNRYLWIAAVAIVVVVLFWLLRTRCYAGDWELMLKYIAAGERWKESSLLDFYLRATVGRALVASWPVWLSTPEPMVRCLTLPAPFVTQYGAWMPTQAAISCLAGGAFVAAALLLGRCLFRLRPERWLFALLVVVQGSLMLFAGYIEVYSMIAVVTVVYLLLAVLALQGRIDLIWPAVTLVIAGAVHLEAFYLIPSFVLLLVLRFREERRNWAGWAAGLFKVGWAGLLVVGVLLLAFMLGGFSLPGFLAVLREGRMGGVDYTLFKHLLYVPPGAQEVYPILSWAQLRAVLNELLLVTPLALPVGVVAFLFLGRAGWRKDWVLLFLLTVGVSALLFIAVWNPDLGPREDWDLLASPLIPLTIAAAYVTLSKVRPVRMRLAVGITWLAVSLLHAGAWILMSHWGV